MNAIGPVEPGPDTHPAPAAPPGPRPAARRRRLLTALGAGCLLAAGALYLARPTADEPAPPRPTPRPVPWPSHTVGVFYTGAMTRPTPADPAFDFTVAVTNTSPDGGRVPEVTVTGVAQPSAALTVTAAPPPPYRIAPGGRRTLHLTMRIRECAKVQHGAGLPFLELTLRNTRAKQQLAFILGDAYAKDLSGALRAACPE